MWTTTNLVCMEVLMYIKRIWQSNYTLHLIHMIIISMVVKSMRNLIHLQNEKIGIFFTN